MHWNLARRPERLLKPCVPSTVSNCASGVQFAASPGEVLALKLCTEESGQDLRRPSLPHTCQTRYQMLAPMLRQLQPNCLQRGHQARESAGANFETEACGAFCPLLPSHPAHSWHRSLCLSWPVRRVVKTDLSVSGSPPNVSRRPKHLK